jgi:hypothetical protein
MADVLVPYRPPQPKVVGITFVSLLKYFPNVQASSFQVQAAAMPGELFRKYPAVPGPSPLVWSRP